MTPDEFAALSDREKKTIRAGLSDIGKAACDYCDLGWSILPLQARSKVPVAGSGVSQACDDWEDACFFWMNNPDCNVGVATGAASGGIVVVDVDQNEEKGKYGADSLFDWEQANGKLPETVCADSGSGGKHYYFRTPTRLTCKQSPTLCIDVKGEGGYVVAPPSVHPCGALYEWDIDPFDEQPAFVDDRTLQFIAYCDERGPCASGGNGAFDFPDSVRDGEGREYYLSRYAFSLRARGMERDEIEAELERVNEERVLPPKPMSDIRRMARSACKKPRGLSPEYQAAKDRAEKAKAEQAERAVADFEAAQAAKQAPTPTERSIAEPPNAGCGMLDRTQDGRVKQTIRNYAAVLMNDKALSGRFSYDMRAYTRMVRLPLPWEPNGTGERPIRDSDYSNFAMYCEGYGLGSKQKGIDALVNVCDLFKRNTVAEWLGSLAWDGEERLDFLLPAFLGCDPSDYTVAVTRTFFAGALSRALTPGQKFDYVPVLIGRQGLGKSVFCRRLACGHRTWFGDNFNTFSGDDAVEKMRGIWIAEISELTALKHSRDNQTIKGFLTACDDTIRPKYGRETEKRKRACVFIGTTNDASFLTDPTGNRRFLPIECGKHEQAMGLWDEGVENHFEQVWAEALQLYKQGTITPTLPSAFEGAAVEMQESYTEDNPNIGLIQGYLDGREEEARELARREDRAPDLSELRVCATELMEKALGVTDYQRQSKFLINEVHEIMQNKISGWARYPKGKGRARCGEYGVQRCYVPKEIANG